MVETKIQQIGDVTIVSMSGRLSHGNSLSATETSVSRLIDGGTRKLVIDLSHLEYMDSSGLGMLIFCGGRMDQTGGRLRIAGANASVARVFDIAHANRVLQFDSDVESSCRRLT
jgi:anti-sigma B factor antagonist